MTPLQRIKPTWHSGVFPPGEVRKKVHVRGYTLQGLAILPAVREDSLRIQRVKSGTRWVSFVERRSESHAGASTTAANMRSIRAKGGKGSGFLRGEVVEGWSWPTLLFTLERPRWQPYMYGPWSPLGRASPRPCEATEVARRQFHGASRTASTLLFAVGGSRFESLSIPIRL